MADDAPTKITPYRNGPYLIRGPFVMVDGSARGTKIIPRTRSEIGPAGRLATSPRRVPVGHARKWQIGKDGAERGFVTFG